ncbi:unnamed protein product, partial [Schistosoma mattheei]
MKRNNLIMKSAISDLIEMLLSNGVVTVIHKLSLRSRVYMGKKKSSGKAMNLAVNKYFLTQQNSSTSKKQKRKRTYQQSNEQPTVIDLTNSDDPCNNSLTELTLSTTRTESIENLPIFNVLSWNIQGFTEESKSMVIYRMNIYGLNFQLEEFHVVCLQEVILVCLEILREKLDSTYDIFSASDHNSLWDYFVVILVKKHPDIKVDADSVSIQPFPNSVMNRHLLSIDLNLSQF